MKKPKAVLISDVHFTPATLEVATSCMKLAIQEARELGVPLIVAGDLLDSKAIIRGECANRLIELFKDARDVYKLVMVGNHDLLNEKGEEHSLNFLQPYCDVVDKLTQFDKSIFMIPYQNNAYKVLELLETIPKGSTLIMHQGVQTAFMGHYMQDKTSLPPETFAEYRVVSGHYHKAQTIHTAKKAGPGFVGRFNYIGSPYTQSFAEAGDGPKGCRILYDDGSLDLAQFNMRRHKILEATTEDLSPLFAMLDATDLVWVKITGPKYELDKIDKAEVASRVRRTDFKLDKIATDDRQEHRQMSKELSEGELLDTLIEGVNAPEEYKTSLKALWREIME